MRLNNRTMSELVERRSGLFGGSALPPGTISAHVRHGDKAAVMKASNRCNGLPCWPKRRRRTHKTWQRLTYQATQDQTDHSPLTVQPGPVGRLVTWVKTSPLGKWIKLEQWRVGKTPRVTVQTL